MFFEVLREPNSDPTEKNEAHRENYMEDQHKSFDQMESQQLWKKNLKCREHLGYCFSLLHICEHLLFNNVFMNLLHYSFYRQF